ncbi:hypothetical protein L1049_015013 [Liquidambar formosana]|uniref:B-like cyclin n=1 Tax=Liquidambar formosana TaxID=63359 RepID=A0AAP0X5U1_LIQFO
MSHSPELSSTSSLYCGEDASDWGDSDTWISDRPPLPSFHCPPSDEAHINTLIDSESHHMPHPDYIRRCRDCSVHLTARQDSINWILKVNACHQFRPVTAMLSINYFDRFLSSQSLPQENGWPFQLLSVACLSLAAKMEEPQAPPLVDLQVSEPKFVFEPKLVQRMELWVMSNLDWRLRSVTPFDFIDHFISQLPCSSSSGSKHGLFSRVFSVSSDLILKTIRVIDFLGFPPSAVAAAAVLSAAGESIDFPASFYEKVNKEMVRSCHQLMEEYLIDTCPSISLKDPGAEPTEPPSPIGVLDAAACGSCDTHRSGTSANPNSSQAEPPSKRLRSSAPDVQQP